MEKEVKTRHYKTSSKERKRIAEEVIGKGEVIDTFFWDKGHPDGPEDHVITSTGLIYIYNHNTKRLITVLIARPAQISRYYLREGKVPPQEIMEIAREHQEKGYNMM